MALTTSRAVKPADSKPRYARNIVAAERGERDKTRDTVHRSEQFWQQLVDNLPGFVIILTASGRVTFLNRKSIEYFGKPADELKNRSLMALIHPDDHARVIETWTKSNETGQTYDIQHRCLGADGVYRWFQVRGLPVLEAKASVTGWYCLITDIDDRRRAEEALDQARAELTHVTRITTLNALTSSIAHEINQPLSGIVTNAGTCLRMLNGDPPDIEGARETVRRTLRDSNRAADVISRLRSLYARRDFALELLDLNDATREVIALSSGDLRRNRIALRSELAESLPGVNGDRVQIQQVILNLLKNASDAMGTINDRPRDLLIQTLPEGHQVRMNVRDTGTGIDPKDLERLFEAFYTTKSGGMGVGLYVSRSIIERHHGRLWAEPNDGPGATFSFSIPSAWTET